MDEVIRDRQRTLQNYRNLCQCISFFVGCFLGMCLLFWGSDYWHAVPDVSQRLRDLNVAIGMIGFFVGSAVARYISED